MKKIITAAMLMAGLAMGANAQLAGLGWDAGWQEIQVRLGLGRNAIDIGGGIVIDPAQDSSRNKFGTSASGLFLGHLHDWGPVDTYFAAGGRLEKPKGSKNVQIMGVVGFQPEVTLLDHIAVSTRFGFEIPLAPDFMIKSVGREISIVNGFSFKILF